MLQQSTHRAMIGNRANDNVARKDEELPENSDNHATTMTFWFRNPDNIKLAEE